MVGAYLWAQMHTIIQACPWCGESDFRPSRWRKTDLIPCLQFLRAFRCRQCGNRFYASRSARTPPNGRAPDHETIIHLRLKNPGVIVRALLRLISVTVLQHA